MALTGSLAVLTRYWVDQLTANMIPLGVKAVFYGDQTNIPYNPTICVEPAPKENELRTAAAARRIDQLIHVACIIYHSAVVTDQVNAEQAIIQSEVIEAFIHADPTANHQVIHCYVTSVEPGYIQRGSTLMRASRLMIEHKTFTVLPS